MVADVFTAQRLALPALGGDGEAVQPDKTTSVDKA